ncbi:MAG: AmmeMemoRadiSam system protein A [Deltaproteobacteria bacterium]|nr:AmmeMemoRadiSam system protein A [Deltaproteobacteria bacterium]
MKENKGSDRQSKPGLERPLNDGEKKTLLAIARGAIESYVREGKQALFDPAEERLRDNAGAFVTIHKNGRLRGCIGTFEADRALYVTVSEMAVEAAARDPRFPPVSLPELQEIDLEVSVLSPRSRIDDPSRIIVGEHGLYITKGFRRGVLLPQVATEQGWDKETFLKHVCLKAGLDTDAWKDPDSVLEVFTAQVFGEKEA